MFCCDSLSCERSNVRPLQLRLDETRPLLLHCRPRNHLQGGIGRRKDNELAGLQ